MKTEDQIREQYRLIRGSLDERGRREWAASEAMALGRAEFLSLCLPRHAALASMALPIGRPVHRGEPLTRGSGVRRVDAMAEEIR